MITYYEDNYVNLIMDNCNVYAPNSEKERIITLRALIKEQSRTERLITRERNAESRSQLTDRLSAINALIGIYKLGTEFEMSYSYQTALISSLEKEKKHRKAARRIAADIDNTPLFCSVGFFGCLDI